MKISIIGRGRVGSSLGKYFAAQGHTVFYGEKKLEGSEIIFITVPDDEILSVWNKIKSKKLAGKLVAHASGALGAGVFGNFKGALSAHPLYAFSAKNIDVKDITFVLEGPGAARAKKLFGRSVLIDAKDKPKYHAACAMASNLVVGLIKTAEDIFDGIGIQKHDWRKLFLINAQNIYNKNLQAALTGPVARGDINTVKKHLTALNKEQKEIYKALSRQILKLSKNKQTEKLLK